MSDHSCNIYYDHSKLAGVKSEKLNRTFYNMGTRYN